MVTRAFYCQWLLTIIIAMYGVFWSSNTFSQEQSEKVFKLLGKTKYRKFYPVISNFDGRVDKVYVRAGESLELNQPLVALRPFNPNLTIHKVFNTLKDTHVIEVERKEGHRVGQYESVITLASRADLVVEAYALDTQIGKLELNQPVKVDLDAGGLEVPLSGYISALHELVDQQKGALKFEVNLDVAQCLTEPTCRRLLRSGVIAQLTLAEPPNDKQAFPIAMERNF